MVFYEIAIGKENKETFALKKGEVASIRKSPAKWSIKELEDFDIVQKDITDEELLELSKNSVYCYNGTDFVNKDGVSYKTFLPKKITEIIGCSESFPFSVDSCVDKSSTLLRERNHWIDILSKFYNMEGVPELITAVKQSTGNTIISYIAKLPLKTRNAIIQSLPVKEREMVRILGFEYTSEAIL